MHWSSPLGLHDVFWQIVGRRITAFRLGRKALGGGWRRSSWLLLEGRGGGIRRSRGIRAIRRNLCRHIWLGQVHLLEALRSIWIRDGWGWCWLSRGSRGIFACTSRNRAGCSSVRSLSTVLTWLRHSVIEEPFIVFVQEERRGVDRPGFRWSVVQQIIVGQRFSPHGA